MADSANKQYSDQAYQLGFHGDYTGTGAQGSEGGSKANSQYVDSEVVGVPVDSHDLSSTGAPGGSAASPPRDGSTATVTDGHWSGIPDGVKSGTTDTSKSALVDPFTHQGDTSTGAGEGSAGHSASGADQSSPWKPEPYGNK